MSTYVESSDRHMSMQVSVLMVGIRDKKALVKTYQPVDHRIKFNEGTLRLSIVNNGSIDKTKAHNEPPRRKFQGFNYNRRLPRLDLRSS